MNLKELAKHLNLSPTTVSRALNGYPEVGAETKRRVGDEARRLGYQPNPHARRLATGRSHAIGHVFPIDRSLMIDPLFSDFVSGAADVYSAHGFEVMLHAGGNDFFRGGLAAHDFQEAHDVGRAEKMRSDHGLRPRSS